MMIELLMAYMASLSFAYIFNLNRKTAFLSAFGGSLGWLFYTLAGSYFQDPNVSYFFGAVAFSYYGELMARKMRTPVTSYITPGLIPRPHQNWQIRPLLAHAGQGTQQG